MRRPSNSSRLAWPARCSPSFSFDLRHKACGCCRVCGRSYSASASSRPAARFRARCSRPGSGTSPPAVPAWLGRTARTPIRRGPWRCPMASGSCSSPQFFIGASEKAMSKFDLKSEPAGRFAYDGLDRVIHEKARLSVLTSLVAHPKGLVFGDLKQMCGLTDGNLSRHLQVLDEARLIEIEKGYDHNRPQTICRITAQGRRPYLDYLKVLEQVVQDAASAAQAGSARRSAPFGTPRLKLP